MNRIISRSILSNVSKSNLILQFKHCPTTRSSLITSSSTSLINSNSLITSSFSNSNNNNNNRLYSTSTQTPNDNTNNNNNNESNEKKEEKFSQKRQISFASLFTALFFGGLGWLYYDHLMVQKREKIKQIETYGNSSIGGGFSLIDENGKAVSDLDFRGKYMFLYFGFTYCPDACPAELDKMTIVLNNLEKHNLLDSIVPVFITIDPWRDTVEQIKQYIHEFHPKFVGLTGTPEQITKLAKSYRVFISKAGKGDSYLVDHTIIEYLIGPDGKFIEFYGSNLTADQVTEKILERMAQGGKGGSNKGEIVREQSMVDKLISLFTGGK